MEDFGTAPSWVYLVMAIVTPFAVEGIKTLFERLPKRWVPVVAASLPAVCSPAPVGLGHLRSTDQGMKTLILIALLAQAQAPPLPPPLTADVEEFEFQDADDPIDGPAELPPPHWTGLGGRGYTLVPIPVEPPTNAAGLFLAPIATVYPTKVTTAGTVRAYEWERLWTNNAEVHLQVSRGTQWDTFGRTTVTGRYEFAQAGADSNGMVRALIYPVPPSVVPPLGPTNFVARRMATPEIDGAFQDWDGQPLARPGFLDRSNNIVTFEILDPKGVADWTGPEDHSIAVQLRHDGTNLFLAVEAADDQHVPPVTGVWNGDSIQVLLTDGAAVVLRYNAALSSTGLVSTTFTAIGGVVEAHAIRINPLIGHGHTNYEIKLPMPGQEFGFALVVNDGDLNSPGQRGWSGWQPHAIVLGEDPAKAVRVTLDNP